MENARGSADLRGLKLDGTNQSGRTDRVDLKRRAAGYVWTDAHADVRVLYYFPFMN